MIREIATGRIWQMLSIVQRRKQNNIYIGHVIQQTPICIGRLYCFIIGTETIHKLTKEDIGKHSGRLGIKSYKEFYQTTLKMRLREHTEFKVYKICYSHLDQENTLMVTPPVPSVTP